MTKTKPTSSRTIAIRAAISVTLLAVAAFVLAKNWATVQASIDAARQANLTWLAIALLLMAETFCVAAAIYGVLALHALRYRQTVLVEVVTAFVNKLLPAGIGGLGLHGVYLYKRGHTAAEATVVVSMNNLIGMTAHLLLLAMVGVFQPVVIRQLLERQHLSASTWFLLAIPLLGILAIPKVWRAISKFMRNLVQSLRKMRPTVLTRAILFAMLLTALYTGILAASARSVGVQLDLLQVFVVFSIGMLTSTATPTPGGLVGAEAGLFAGFVAYGVPPAAAGAATLLYRLVSYWLPLLPGAVALLVARRHKII